MTCFPHSVSYFHTFLIISGELSKIDVFFFFFWILLSYFEPEDIIFLDIILISLLLYSELDFKFESMTPTKSISSSQSYRRHQHNLHKKGEIIFQIFTKIFEFSLKMTLLFRPLITWLKLYPACSILASLILISIWSPSSNQFALGSLFAWILMTFSMIGGPDCLQKIDGIQNYWDTGVD